MELCTFSKLLDPDLFLLRNKFYFLPVLKTSDLSLLGTSHWPLSHTCLTMLTAQNNLVKFYIKKSEIY